MTHSIEFLKNAKQIGATHIRGNTLYKGGAPVCSSFRYNNNSKQWEVDYGTTCAIDVPAAWNRHKIDFSLLDDYQQDKALDIAATGIAE